MPPEPEDDPLPRLGRSLAAGLIDRAGFRHQVTAFLQQQLGCSQVLMWRGDPLQTPRELHCGAERLGAAVRIDTGDLRHEAELADYLAYLGQHGLYLDTEPGADALAAQARRLHLSGEPAMLHAAFVHNGVLLGLLCCGRDPGTPAWTQADALALRRHATTISRYIGRIDGTGRRDDEILAA